MQSKISALGRKLRSRATLQFKFSLSYILVIAAVLILLNSYPLLVSQNLMVSSTQANLRSTAKVIESALMGLEQLTEENVNAALSGLNEAGATRIMVTDSAGAPERQRLGAGKKRFGSSEPLEPFRKALHRPSERQAVCR